jgi:peptidoglycan biosynthesis protein MviN/MurJ (putative lipid II flippase)
VGPYREGGLASAFSISYIAGFSVSLVLFSRVAGGWPDLRALLSGILRTSITAGVMAAAVWGVGWFWPWIPVLARIAVGAAVFLLVARFLCPEEWRQTQKLRSRADP